MADRRTGRPGPAGDTPSVAGAAPHATEQNTPPDRRRPRWIYGTGDEPDPRFTLANERTFLAWIRTCLALIVTGVAVHAVEPGTTGRVVAVMLAAAGTAIPLYALMRWAGSERALRRGRPLPGLPALPLVAGVALVGALTAVALAT